ncbi:hypothetical protein EXIGLDRAFT_693175 [Exidia glandulosa HHB12029]|uniref:Uncharacterized protein n=1 Tax=Exidia glandulosa HHB12029 TaxID=1314781 RepID=A0A165HGI5_EXIGL|nr:hypothetical protein EXIGLDRAFT_693175 [Exidia glandulosa HHB12029]
MNFFQNSSVHAALRSIDDEAWNELMTWLVPTPNDSRSATKQARSLFLHLIKSTRTNTKPGAHWTSLFLVLALQKAAVWVLQCLQPSPLSSVRALSTASPIILTAGSAPIPPSNSKSSSVFDAGPCTDERTTHVAYDSPRQQPWQQSFVPEDSTTRLSYPRMSISPNEQRACPPGSTVNAYGDTPASTSPTISSLLIELAVPVSKLVNHDSGYAMHHVLSHDSQTVYPQPHVREPFFAQPPPCSVQSPSVPSNFKFTYHVPFPPLAPTWYPASNDLPATLTHCDATIIAGASCPPSTGLAHHELSSGGAAPSSPVHAPFVATREHPTDVSVQTQQASQLHAADRFNSSPAPTSATVYAIHEDTSSEDSVSTDESRSACSADEFNFTTRLARFETALEQQVERLNNVQRVLESRIQSLGIGGHDEDTT